MFLSQLTIQGVRNLASCELELAPGFNYLVGPNGAGKTAALESVHILSRGRSFRSGSLASVIREGDEALVVSGSITDGAVSHRLGLQKGRRAAIALRLDGERVTRMSEMARLLPIQSVLPDSSEVIFGGPGLRRGYLDWGLFHVKPEFLALSRRYNRVLQQRNAWLRSEDGRQGLGSDPWFEAFCEAGTELDRFRGDYLAALAPHVEAALEQLSAGLNLELAYHAIEDMRKTVSDSWPRDVKLGVSTRGPHRSDLLIKLDGSGASARLSRGQAKAVASALLMGQAQHMKSSVGVNCVFLIDDFGAELDAEHWRQFLGALAGMGSQVIATSTELIGPQVEWLDRVQCELFHVEQGEIHRR